MKMKIKNDSITRRIVTISCLTIFLSLLITGIGLSYLFKVAIYKGLESHLLAHTDILIANSKFDKDGNFILDKKHLDVLNIVPKYWQINVNGLIAYQSELLNNPIPITNESLEPQIIEFFNDNNKIIGIQHSVKFPHNNYVTYSLGVQSDIADALILSNMESFSIKLLAILVILAVIFIILIIIQLRYSLLPIKKVKSSLLAVKNGSTHKLETNDLPKEIKPLADEINSLITYSEETILRHRTFAANLSHSLKTPLTVMINESKKHQNDFGRMIKEKSEIMISIIERNLARSKIAGSSPISGSRTDLSEILNTITKNFAKLYKKQYQVNSEAVCIIRADSGDMYELFGNLIENAFKYCNNEIIVTIQKKAGISITIEDDGKGIDPKNYTDVLNRGTRLDTTKPGHGIGLAVSNDIVKLYNGSLSLDTSSLGGLKITIVIPSA